MTGRKSSKFLFFFRETSKTSDAQELTPDTHENISGVSEVVANITDSSAQMEDDHSETESAEDLPTYLKPPVPKTGRFTVPITWAHLGTSNLIS